jgi:excinuclease ABC subunit C
VLFYVGKSKRLRARLLSYFSPKVKNKKTGRLMRKARSILWESAPSEFAALLRELQLIQYWRPSRNVKDIPLAARTTFVCLGRPTAPGVFVSTNPAGSVLAAFGPVWPGRELARAVEALNRLFLLRDCPNSQPVAFSDQTQRFAKEVRPGCLRFDLNTCLGPCVSACTKRAYMKNVNQARRFLEGGEEARLTELVVRMQQAAQSRQYELATRIRDDLKALAYLRDRLGRVREAQSEYHFVYPVSAMSGETLWYLIRGGRVAAVTRFPIDIPSAKTARDLLGETYSPGPIPQDLTSQRPDTLLLVTSWFQQNPAEMAKTLSPAEARKRCGVRRRAG